MTEKISLWDTVKENGRIASTSFLNELNLNDPETFTDSPSTRTTSYSYLNGRLTGFSLANWAQVHGTKPWDFTVFSWNFSILITSRLVVTEIISLAFFFFFANKPSELSPLG